MDTCEYICFFQNLNIFFGQPVLWSGFFPVQIKVRFLGSSDAMTSLVLITLLYIDPFCSWFDWFWSYMGPKSRIVDNS
jgi:hypothetical protein